MCGRIRIDLLLQARIIGADWIGRHPIRVRPNFGHRLTAQTLLVGGFAAAAAYWLKHLIG
jgi:hypothetical protein